ncbi:MAG: T9SS type A sorting domain-containing protein [Chitinophagales bacterium]
MRFSTLILTAVFLVVASFSSLLAQNLEIYVSDAGNFNLPPWQILKFDENGENPEVFISESLAWPQDILFLEDQGIVLISNFSTNRINKYDAKDGHYLGIFKTGISGPTRMKIGADGLLYVLQWSGTGRVKRYQLDGTFVGDFTNVGVPESIGLDWDKDGNLYVSSYYDGLVHKFGVNGEDLGLFINSNLMGPTNIWFDANGDLLVLDYDGTSVKRFNSEGVYQGSFIGGLSKTEGVDFFPNGNILIGNGATSSVKMYDSEGNYIKDLVPSGSANLKNPNAVIIRDPTSVAIEEVDFAANFVTPTVGTNFNFISQNSLNFDWIEVFSTSGTFVERIEMKNHSIWNASEYAEGLYILVAKRGNKVVATQKVLVQH